MSALLSRDSLPLDDDELEALDEEGVVWRVIPGFQSYEASSLGQIMNWGLELFPEGKLVAPPKGRTKFKRTDGVSVSQSVGRLVARAFLGPRPERHRLRYLDGNSLNCALPNLCWESDIEQASRQLEPFVKGHSTQENCFRGHPLSGDNMRRSRDGWRVCITCARAFETARVRRRKQRSRGEEPTWTTELVLWERGQIEFDILISIQ